MPGNSDGRDSEYESTMFRPPIPNQGERAAGWVAANLANWWVPTGIVLLVAIWVMWNWTARPFQPYPVVVLAVISAVLSTVTAAQGPLILLAQRRASMNDRARDEETFRVAIRSEIDLQLIAARLDDIVDRLERLEQLNGDSAAANETAAGNGAVDHGTRSEDASEV